ncbi:MAG: leucine-rich repeat domain-containing protein, partial [Clostridia bacterium]|nr:leucine-rich repeat domain-containing protein [Clostridia bacterium]
MKKVLLTILILVLVGCTAFFVWDNGLINKFFGDYIAGLKYEYSDDADGYIVVGAGTYKDSSNIVVPERYLGKYVESIGAHAFENCTSLKSITISSKVGSIDEKAFAGCSSLTNITLPNVKLIGEGAFTGCNRLTNITLPNVKLIGEGAFTGCNRVETMSLSLDFTRIKSEVLKNYGSGRKWVKQTDYYPVGFIFGTASYPESVEIQQSSKCVTQIGESTVSTSSYYIPKSLTSITILGSYSFHGYEFENFKNLTHLVIAGERISNIGTAFATCSDLTHLTFTSAVTKVSTMDSEYKFPQSLTNVTVEETNPLYYSEGNSLIERESKTLIFCCNNDVIPHGVTSIGEYAFSNSSNLTNIIIPDSITSIGDSAFYNCENLNTVMISNSVTSINDWTLYNFKNISTITITDS